jgi:uncharacterized protein (DUF305 family)
MKNAVAVLLFAAALSPAQAQQTSRTEDLPAACRESDGSEMMSGMDDMMNRNAETMRGMMERMSAHPRELQRSVMGMDRPMMMGAMAKDPDVAWMCAMIPHHRGAIEMARTGLRLGDDADAKKLAE